MEKEKGFTLVEVIVALALVGIIAVGFFMALSTASKALIVADERATAESLARSQMEYTKNGAYINYAVLDHEYYSVNPDLALDHYSIDITAAPVDPATGLALTFNEEQGIYEQDLGIQKITVAISHDGNEVLILEEYKANR